MKNMLDKFYGFIEKIGKHNFILIVFVVFVLVLSGVYQTFSLYTQSAGVSVIEGIKTFRFILGSDQADSVVIAGESSKNIAITVSNHESKSLRYGVYYSSSSDLSQVNLGYLSTSDYPGTGLIDAGKDYIVTLKVENQSKDSVVIDFGLAYGVENGGELILEENQKIVEEFFPLLSSVPVGSYVAYVGDGGIVGETGVSCQKDGVVASSSIAEEATESPNSCYGQNAREDLETETEGYGYCGDSSYRYTTTGWRVAYIEDTVDSSPQAVLVSAGSPECNMSTLSEMDYGILNAKALKYCNTEYVDGNCTCESSVDGICDSSSADAWVLGDSDFYAMTKAITGVGKRLTDTSSELGEFGGTLGEVLYCVGNFPYAECGYENDLLDNGGVYRFGVLSSSRVGEDVFWSPEYRGVYMQTNSSAFGLRPMIRLSASVFVTGGSGTMDDPYTIVKR